MTEGDGIASAEVMRIIGDVVKAFLHVHCDNVGFNRVIIFF